MKKIAAIFLLFLFFIPFVTADGMMYVQDQDLWSLQNEQQQVAAINYENGFENLLISINPGRDLKGTKGIWIFPVPAAPDKITIDVVKGYPYFSGNDIDKAYTEDVNHAYAIMIEYATFPLSLFTGIPFMFGTTDYFMEGHLSSTNEITVHQSIEKMGVTSELITTTEPAAISNYLLQKGFTIPQPAQSSLNSYIGQDYSFVVVYISDIAAYSLAKENNYDSGEMIGSFVKFPTDTMYYPLKPTRVYGDRQIPVLLYVTGHVTPEIYDDIRTGTTVSYYTQNEYHTGEGLETFFNGKESITNLEYTKIKINTPSDDFFEDLWINDEEPFGLALKKTYIGNFALLGVLFYLLFSMMASLLAGILWLREKPVPRSKMLLHGLWNALTLIGFIYGTKKTFDGTVYQNRRFFVLSFYLFFAIFLSIYTFVLNPSAIVAIPGYWIIAIIGPVFFLGPAKGIASLIILCLIIWIIYKLLESEIPTETGIKQTRQFRLLQMNRYEKRWGAVIGIGALLIVAGIVTNVFIKNGVVGQLGILVLILGLFFYSLNIFGTGILREKIIATILFVLPFIVPAILLNTTGLLNIILLIGISYAVLAIAVRIKRIILRLSGSETAANEQPNLRLVVVLGLICILLLLPQVTVLIGLPHPQAVIQTDNGDTLARNGMYDEALIAYSNAIKIDHNYATAYEHRGDLYFYQGKYQAASSDYYMASLRDINNAVLHYKHGTALEKEGYIFDARNEYQKAILIDPNYEEAKEALRILFN